VTNTAKKLLTLGGSKYLKDLRGSNNEKLRDALTKFPGVGPKVGDCIALFSLDATSIVPVDTHVWRIACRDYDDANGTLRNAKSVTKKLYQHVGNVFYERFGTYAGWAHSLMFAAELPQFRSLLPETIREDMTKFSKWEKSMKQKARDEAKKRRIEQEEKKKCSSSSSSSSTSAPKKKKKRRKRDGKE
jgi:N-glycosylase/DNA lyase